MICQKKMKHKLEKAAHIARYAKDVENSADGP